MWKEAIAPDGRKYYYDSVTQQTTWTKPADFDDSASAPAQAAPQSAAPLWKEATNPADGRKYYYNTATGATTWDKPAELQQQAAPINGTHDTSEQRFDRRDRLRDDAPARGPGFEGGRPNGMPWERREETLGGFRGAQPAKLDEPEFSNPQLAQDAFFKLLRSHGVKHDSTWEDAIRVVAKEKGYRAFKDPRERKEAFEKFCKEEQALEQSREQERKQKTREEFRAMLQTHDDIQFFTRWNTAKPMLEREIVFRNAGGEEERRAMFHEYIADLQKAHLDDEASKRKQDLLELDDVIAQTISDARSTWQDAQEAFKQSGRFDADGSFKSLSKADILHAFSSRMQVIGQHANESTQERKRHRFRQYRKAREDFKRLLAARLQSGDLRASTKWQSFHPTVAQEPSYLNLLGVPGSTPLELFWDVIEEEDQYLRPKRNVALDVLESARYELTPDTPYDEFQGVMRKDQRTDKITNVELEEIYLRLLDKVKKRYKDDKLHAKRDKAHAMDAFRAALRRVDSPIQADQKYEMVLPKLEALPEYRALDDDELRREVFNKYISRMQERADDRERARRDRDRERRNGSRRSYDHERERDRRHRSRSPEVNIYEADRHKAQTDRERQYRKASFGLSPPPRDRRDERYERDRRSDKYESVYDRERRERDVERERNYVSRADPRDKGKNSTLDYGDEETTSSRPGSARKRRESGSSTGSRRSAKVRKRS